jgi:hypothetical protein
MRHHDPDFPESSSKPANFGEMISEKDWPLNIPADMNVPVPPYLPSTEIAVNDIRRVYSNIIELDRQIGIIISQLEEDQLLDSTIVFFYSDHGGPLPRQKRLIYDSGIKVPMVIRYPGQVGAGFYDDQLISFIDFAPTIFSVSGIKIPDYVQGEAFSGNNRSRKERKYIHAAADRFDAQVDMIRAVRDDRYKYLLNFYPEKPYYLPVKYREQMAIMRELLRLKEIDSLDASQALWFREKKMKEELFDTWEDPYELLNLADNPDYADKLMELRAECTRWMESIHDMGEIPEAEILEKFWPGRDQPLTAAPSYEVIDGELILGSETEGANIGYKMYGYDESAPEEWEVYTQPLTIIVDTRIEAVAHRLGYEQSEMIKIEFR